MIDTSLGQLHTIQNVFGPQPELGLLLVRSKVQAGDQFTEFLIINLFAVVVEPLDDFLLVFGVVLAGHGNKSEIYRAVRAARVYSRFNLAI